MAITSLDGLVAALPGQRKRLYKTSRGSASSGTFADLFLQAGTPGAAATPPVTNGEIPTSATQGAIPFTDPGGGLLSYLATFAVGVAQIGTLILYDRLFHNSGLVGNITTAQTFTTPALTRPDNLGGDVEMWIQEYTAIGTAAHTLTATYVNQAGTAARAATLTNTSGVAYAGQMTPFVLQAGDTGVRSISQVQWDVSTGTAGNFGIVLLRRLVEIPLSIANVGVLLDTFNLGMPQVYDSACLAMMVLCSTSSTGQLIGSATLAQG